LRITPEKLKSSPLTRDRDRHAGSPSTEARGNLVPAVAIYDAVYELFVPLNEEVVADYCTLEPGALADPYSGRCAGG
jgi:hypothetical protein